jgi:hypothetical protein
MIRYPAPPIPQEIVDKIEVLVRESVPQQQVIWEMRGAGLPISRCIKLASQVYGIDLTEAKKIVHFSDAWASMRGEYDAFHEMAFEAAKETAKLDGWEVVEEDVALRNAS